MADMAETAPVHSMPDFTCTVAPRNITQLDCMLLRSLPTQPGYSGYLGRLGRGTPRKLL